MGSMGSLGSGPRVTHPLRSAECKTREKSMKYDDFAWPSMLQMGVLESPPSSCPFVDVASGLLFRLHPAHHSHPFGDLSDTTRASVDESVLERLILYSSWIEQRIKSRSRQPDPKLKKTYLPPYPFLYKGKKIVQLEIDSWPLNISVLH